MFSLLLSDTGFSPDTDALAYITAAGITDPVKKILGIILLRP